MLINDKHVTGLFKYNSGAEYEKNDFVIFGDGIYICTAEQVSGVEPPSDSTRFTPYPGELISSVDEYYKFINGESSSGDKYISSSVMNKVMQDSFFGFNEIGLISDYVKYDCNSKIISYSKSIKDSIKSFTSSILDDILFSEKLNNGMLTIDYDLPEIKALTKIDPLSTDPSLNYILRQYTYFDSKFNCRIRIQELLNFSTGQIMSRFVKGTQKSGDIWDYSVNVPSMWINSIENDELVNKVNYLLSYYTGSADLTFSTTSGSFRFKSFEIDDSTSDLNSLYIINSDSDSVMATKGIPYINFKDKYKKLNYRTSNVIITFLILDKSSKIYKTYESSIDLFDCNKTPFTYEYYITDEIKLKLVPTEDDSKPSDKKYYIYITLEKNDSVTSSIIIKDIYYRCDE